jgi:hypothetical protein
MYGQTECAGSVGGFSVTATQVGVPTLRQRAARHSSQLNAAILALQDIAKELGVPGKPMAAQDKVPQPAREPSSSLDASLWDAEASERRIQEIIGDIHSHLGKC